MKIYQMADAVRYSRMNTDELRDTFLVDDISVPSRLRLAYVDLDRTVIGFATPVADTLTLPCPPELRADYFCERRELGILNVGGPGVVTVDGERFDMSALDTLYVGRGAMVVTFTSLADNDPSSFYLLSYPAHTSYPTTLSRFSDLTPLELGSAQTCNHRKIYKAIHLEGIRSCQLVMGFTLLETGSCWNTMPPHTHMRRSEIYMYFNVDPSQRIVHLMGPPDATKHLIVQDKQVTISPGWSIHAGVGTASYGFCWGMGGENQQYTDMDPVTIADLK
jgi:4-deoxy-L-threo-5-hexosulose-uronate ketol-isomerase